MGDFERCMPGNICVLNADDPLVMSLPVPVGVKKILLERYRNVELVSGPINMEIPYRHIIQPAEVKFVIPSPGLHLALDACAAAAVATFLGVLLALCGKSFSTFIPIHGRKVAILGDMLELRPKEIMFHELILQHCLDARIDLMALVGKRFLTAAENLNIDKGMKLYPTLELFSGNEGMIFWKTIVAEGRCRISWLQ
ncbi:UDP-N-acetylmuramoyl-tripeptide--D-alanyl-D-alanine ligase [Olea europaea subsp. europaea]|uniref:UDP-N-acetylmuramoyl-tripeptide--D-alanyl-D-alanine ligase n=1 Tax=Olea europaea subsp. europaea TaxID=158383 RepID=A0A8S0TTX6_OLEEU|nr:UDP-N-acetylmuramoyl-tripeptide--D-alanyl-D-alanine ligase [Olea europaea subsp. europaea]